MLPHTGQGANQWIEDALAIVLEGVGAADIPDALQHYESLRRERAWPSPPQLTQWRSRLRRW